MTRKKYSSYQDYLKDSPKKVSEILKKIHTEVKDRIPTAEVTISYNIPSFKDPKPFIYFAGFKNHIGIYPPVQNKTLQKKLKSFMNDKGNLSFPLDQEIPIKLIGDIAIALWKQRQKS
jgi:uncharacterized protein YdhG (YjbR/CyaY superfamily)